MTLLAMDEFSTLADDARLAWVAVAIVLQLTSVRGLSVGNIANRLGVSTAAIKRYTDRFARMADLDSDGGLQFIGNGTRSNGDNPTSIQA